MLPQSPMLGIALQVLNAVGQEIVDTLLLDIMLLQAELDTISPAHIIVLVHIQVANLQHVLHVLNIIVHSMTIQIEIVQTIMDIVIMSEIVTHQ